MRQQRTSDSAVRGVGRIGNALHEIGLGDASDGCGRFVWIAEELGLLRDALHHRTVAWRPSWTWESVGWWTRSGLAEGSRCACASSPGSWTRIGFAP